MAKKLPVRHGIVQTMHGFNAVRGRRKAPRKRPRTGDRERCEFWYIVEALLPVGIYAGYPAALDGLIVLGMAAKSPPLRRCRCFARASARPSGNGG